MIQVVRDKLIRLGGELYTISTTEADNNRREEYFENGTGSLTPDETRLLENIGFNNLDEQLSKVDKAQLPEFFKALPHCQTSAAISLSAKCYKPRYIITEILRHAAMKDQEIHEEMARKGAPSLDWMGKTASFLNGIMGRISGSPSIRGVPEVAVNESVEEDSIYDFFLLRI
jgi:hypothetical protein